MTVRHGLDVALLVFTCGRKNYLQRTLESLATNCDFDFRWKIMVDDSGDPDFAAWLKDRLWNWRVVSHTQNRGLAAAIQTGWDALVSEGAQRVFHLEEDFTFEHPVNIDQLVGLRYAYRLDQVVLYRQPWSPQEIAAGGYLKSDDRWQQVRDTNLWVGSHLFSFNPCYYTSDVFGRVRPGLEADVTASIAADHELRSGVLTANDGGPLCWHIGAERLHW